MLQLRLLQTVVEVAAEKNSTLVMPLPVEMLRFFEAAARGEAILPTTNATESQLPAPESRADAAPEPRSEPLLSTNGQGVSPAEGRT